MDAVYPLGINILAHLRQVSAANAQDWQDEVESFEKQRA